MIPAPTATPAPDPTPWVEVALGRIDPSTTVLARALPLPDGVILDLLACDDAGHPVLVLAGDGPAEQLFPRAARALVAYARAAPLLGRLYPAAEPEQAPRLVVVASRVHDLDRALFGCLRVARVDLVEAIVTRPGEPPVIVPRGEEPAPRRSPHQNGRSAARAVRGRRPAPVRALMAASPIPATPSPAPLAVPPARAGAQPDPLFDQLRERLCRLAAGVEVERAGGDTRFLLAGQVLAELRRDRGSVRVVAGGPDAPAFRVDDAASLAEAMDAVFAHFFTLAPQPPPRLARPAPARTTGPVSLADLEGGAVS